MVLIFDIVNVGLYSVMVVDMTAASIIQSDVSGHLCRFKDEVYSFVLMSNKPLFASVELSKPREALISHVLEHSVLPERVERVLLERHEIVTFCMI